MNHYGRGDMRIVFISEKETKVIGNLIKAKIQELDLKKVCPEDTEYVLLYNIYQSLLNSMAKKSIILPLSEKEYEGIRNLIESRIEELDMAKDNLDDSEYGVLHHIKIELLNSIAEKHFRLDGAGIAHRSAIVDFLNNIDENKL